MHSTALVIENRFNLDTEKSKQKIDLDNILSVSIQYNLFLLLCIRIKHFDKFNKFGGKQNSM